MLAATEGRAEERMACMSQNDHLVGLANRVLFQDRLRRALVRADRDGTLVTLLLVDLDRSKADPRGLLLPGVGSRKDNPISRLPIYWSFRVVVQSGALVGVVFGGILSGELCRCA